VDSSQIVLVEGLVILVIVLAIAIHQLWTVRRPPKDREKARDDTPD